MTSVYDYSATLADGTTTALSDYKGQVLLIVNTASKCGFTPQYEGLEKLHATHKDAGFSVLAFPCNQFGSQEPGSTEEIVEFCEMRFQTSFPLFEKIDVNGTNSHPLYKHLKSEVKGLLGTERIKWNFTKFLIDADGNPYKRYSPNTEPIKIESDIAKLIG